MIRVAETMQRSMLALCLVAALHYLAACSSTPKISSLDDSPTLAELPRARMPVQQAVTSSTLDTVSESYRQALALVDDPRASEDIMRRLALLELRQAEEIQLASVEAEPARVYQNAIQTYELLLEAQQNRDDNDVLWYSLAKARELSGDLDGALAAHNRLVEDYPGSQYFAESQFRRGELLFSDQRYAQAGKAYAAVIEHADEHSENSSPFLVNAHYMLGWSRFKLSRYDSAMRSFVVVLDDYHENRADAGERLSDDTFRVIALAFSYRDGASSIADLLNEVGERDYSSELYSRLGDLYLEKKRYVDSAGVFGEFIARYPESSLSPQFQQRRIDAFIAGRYPEQVREGKRVFARQYSIGGDYWVQADGGTREFIAERLTLYIDELASYHHALAQSQQAKLKSGDSEFSVEQVRSEFLQAASWYEAWIRSFPEAEDIASKYFLVGETRFEAADYPAAIDAYEMAAYSYPAFEDAAESGYAALLAYDPLIARATSNTGQGEEPVVDWSAKKIESALMFAENFVGDTRRNPVLAQTVETLLSRQDYPRTITVATLLLQSDAITPELQLTAQLSRGHAHTALSEHASAEQDFAAALQVMDTSPQLPQRAELYQPTRENYAASIYRQGEQASEAGDLQLAATQFMRVVNTVPESTIRVSAQHDASVLLMQTEQWSSAIAVISDFQQRFPEHEASRTASARLLQANQQLGDWSAAAAQAMAMHQNDPDPVARQQALFLAAELYEKAGDTAAAIAAYRDYAHGYPDAMAERMEAQYRLVALYQQQGAEQKRLFWIRQLVTTHDQAGAPSERSLWLAAYASSELASIDMQQYKSLRLGHPLKRSLAKKRGAMDTAMASYQKVHDYGVAEFATQATQRMGEIYASFATALLESERPAGLSELEREQYDMLLEEQAYPFEEEAIALFKVNVERAWQGTYNEATTESYKALAKLLPARYARPEIRPAIVSGQGGN